MNMYRVSSTILTISSSVEDRTLEYNMQGPNPAKSFPDLVGFLFDVFNSVLSKLVREIPAPSALFKQAPARL